MTSDELNKLKENKEVKFIYKLPCSFYPDGYEYIVIGTVPNEFKPDQSVKCFLIENWFKLIDSGSLLPYVCCTLNKKYKIKEYLNIYQKPDILKLRKYFGKLTDVNEIIQEGLWAIQYITEGKVNRVDVFKDKYIDTIYVINRFYEIIDPIYKMSLNNK